MNIGVLRLHGVCASCNAGGVKLVAFACGMHFVSVPIKATARPFIADHRLVVFLQAFAKDIKVFPEYAKDAPMFCIL